MQTTKETKRAIPEVHIIQNGESDYFKSFDFSQVKVLVVCRGPIRKEAIEIFTALGCGPTGILLSEKDSIVYRLALSPELRMLDRERDVHPIADYMGSGGAKEKTDAINRIIEIAKTNGYTHLFAGYGFMAEDEEFVAAIEKSGLRFIGPNSGVIAQAGAKDEAKKIARKVNISVTPGVDNITAITLSAKVGGDLKKLKALAKDNGLAEPRKSDILEACDEVLGLGYDKNIDLITIEELQKQALSETENIWKNYKDYRIRFKYIGGGGGKGQRVISTADQVADAVKEVLVESKVTGVGDNKNFLIELNIENTRHNEIQLLGNGKWCISLGGRDCSLQMHEQKLVEVSLTDTLFEAEIKAAQDKGDKNLVALLKTDREKLARMEKESMEFGMAVGLDSASTWECIVDDKGHYFMEMNTRIQVEHRVSELAYRLKFTNPKDKKDYFILDSLVGAMLFMSVFGSELHKPDLVPREVSGTEVRLNATNQALQPHAGGILTHWSHPHELEIRDDQGIGIPNEDTGRFIKYNLAGAYDSNAALTLSWGDSRYDNFANLIEVMRVMEIGGIDVETNLDFQYGIVNWFYGQHHMAKPNTQFVYSYLGGVGALQGKLNSFDPAMALRILFKKHDGTGSGGQVILTRKQNLVIRPLTVLRDNAHTFAGWIGRNRNKLFSYENGKLEWLANPIEIWDSLYWIIHFEQRATPYSPQRMIWPEDETILAMGREFYQHLAEADLDYLDKLKKDSTIKAEISSDEINAAHNGFGLGLEVLVAMIHLADEAGFMGFKVNDDLSVFVPEQFQDKDTCATNIEHLAPAPEASSNEIISWTGGTFYSKETPDSPSFVQVGDHFEKGQALGILEVMKMFNKIPAPFAGTVRKVLVEGDLGHVVSKGQVIFEVEPDVEIVLETPAEKAARIKKTTDAAMAAVL